MTTITWTNIAGGDWETGTNWSSTPNPPASGDDVAITLAGSYTVTVEPTVSVNAILLDDPDATLSGAFASVNTIDLAAGTLHLNDAVLSGTTIVGQGGTLTAYQSTLSDVTVIGTLLVGPYAELGVVNGLTAVQPDGVSPGVIDMIGPNSVFMVSDSETFDNIVFVNPVIQGGQVIPGGPALTLRRHATIDVTIGGALAFDTITNDGTIAVQAGASLAISSFATDGFQNAGTISVASGGGLTLNGGFRNTGSISLGNATSSLVLWGSDTVSGLGAISSSGADIAIWGTLDNTGGTLVIAPGSAFGNLSFGPYGVLQGGTVVEQGGAVDLAGGTLANLVWRGPFNVTSETVTLDNVTVEALNGGPGTINLSDATLVVQGDGTLDGVTLNASGSFDAITTGAGYPPPAGSLTFGSAATLNATGDAVALTLMAETIANDGTIDISAVNGIVVAEAADFTYTGSFDFTNAGIINVGSGDVFQAGASSLTIPLAGTFDNAGLIKIANGGTLLVSKYINTFSNTGTINLAGAGSTLAFDGTVAAAALGDISGGTGELDIAGLFNNTGNTLKIGPGGEFADLKVSRTISGGTISAATGSEDLNDGTLNGVTWDGPLDINGFVSVSNGLSVRSAQGQQGTIALVGTGLQYLNFLDNEELNNVLLDVADTTGGYVSDTGTLTVGATSTLTVGAPGVTANTYLPGLTLSATALINDGLISSTLGSGFPIDVQTTIFVDTGTIAISGDGNAFILTAASFTNSGTVTATDGAALYVDVAPDETFSNTGTISLDASSTLVLGGTITRAMLAEFTTADGPLAIAGTLINSGETLVIAPGTRFGDLRIGQDDVSNTTFPQAGTIQGGTVIDQGGSLFLQNAVLDGVVWQAPVDLSAANQSLSIVDGTTLEPLAGNSQTMINLTGSGSSLTFDTETLTNTEVSIGAADGPVTFAGPTLSGLLPIFGQPVPPTPVLTLAASTTLTAATPGAGLIQLDWNITNQGMIDDAEGNVSLGSFSPPPLNGSGIIIVQPFPISDVIFDNQGTIRADAGPGSTFTIGDLTTLTNEGLIQVGNGDDLIVETSTCTNTGTIAIATDGTVTFTGSSVAALGTIAFTDGTLIIDATGTGVTTTLVNFDATDQIIVNTESAATFSLSGSAVAVIENGLTVAALDFATPDALTDYVLCFLAGTLITTPTGQTAVERLTAGDTVLTAAGQVRPIAWIGHGRVLATRGRRSAATPVIVRKGALAPNVPFQDLHVTKGHAVLIDGVLIPIEFLVNHRSILWDDRAQEVRVYHVELESHDVLLANGAPAESYRDDGNRWLCIVIQGCSAKQYFRPHEDMQPTCNGSAAVPSRRAPHQGVFKVTIRATASNDRQPPRCNRAPRYRTSTCAAARVEATVSPTCRIAAVIATMLSLIAATLPAVACIEADICPVTTLCCSTAPAVDVT